MTGVGLPVSERLRESVVRRVLLAVSRFSPQLRKVAVHLAESSNPLGGVDQQCWMQAWLPRGGSIRTGAIDGQMDSAVVRAARRLAERVAWDLDGRSEGAAATGSPRPRPPARKRGSV